MNKWKRIIGICVLLFLVAAAFGFYLYNKKPADIRKATTQFKLTSTLLVEEFNKDETAANKKYLDKIISVKGNITDIKIDTSGEATIFLDSADPMAAVTCSFYKDEAASLKTLQKGNTVIIKGNCTGKLMDVVLNKCSIVQ